jgi:beta-mannosidase
MTTIDCAGDWRLIRVATDEAIPAQVPGDTHSALLAAGRIPDPYEGTNELAVQWVGKEDWIYERTFEAGDAFLSEEKKFLSCDCLDTCADVLLNGRKIGSADNMFTRWLFDATGALKPGTNTIRIRFRSAEKAALAESRKLPYPVPHQYYPVQSPHRNLIRKTQCHAGWDWGPCLMVAGIYGDISLCAYSDLRIDYVLTEQKHSRGRCVVRVQVECDVVRDGPYELAVTLGDLSSSRTVRLARGRNSPHLDITVDDPRLWWPNGYGEQPLYPLSVKLGSQEVRKRIGLRTIILVNREDKAGLSMTVRVNDVDVFCKGANWIPADALPQRQTPERLKHLLSSAVAAHMNMLRVWGGGQYEGDEFYSLCDQKGLLVWQDMMFACALYPATPAFLARVEAEIRHQVKRLRDHPCIALWCGNNEDVGALTWFPESRANRDRYIVDYDRLNEGVVGRLVDECDPTRTFWPSSPSAGRGDYSDNWHDDARGDMHCWSVWHEGKPFSAYYAVKPRFCSEFGYQSFPSLHTIRTYAREEDLNVTSPVMEHHQRHRGGNGIITEMFARNFRVPEGFENFIYLSQVQQALAIKTAVEYWRHLRPLCMGTLYWQLNDTWPVCSWSSVEYDGTWKLLHYAAKRFFAPTLLAAQLTEGTIEVWLTNDRREEARHEASIFLIDFEGKVLARETLDARVPAGSARLLKRSALSDLAPSPAEAFLYVALTADEETVGNELFLTEPKRCRLSRAAIEVDVRTQGKGFIVRLSSDVPAFHVALSAADIPGEFADNFFTLLPGTPRSVLFTPRAAVQRETLVQALAVRHLRDTYR